MPKRRAKPSRRLMPAGPGVPMRIVLSMPRARTSLIHARTGSVSNANCVRIVASSPCCFERRRLVFQRPPEHLVRDVGVTLGVAGDRHLVHAVVQQEAGADDVVRVLVRTLRRGRVAADDEDAVGRADILQPAEELLELAGCEARRRAEMCGTGTKPSSRTALAAATRISRSSLPRKVTLILVPTGIDVLRLEQAGHVLAGHLERVVVQQFERRLTVGQDVGGRDTDRGSFRSQGRHRCASEQFTYVHRECP